MDKLLAATGMIYNRTSRKRVEEKIQSFRPDIIHVHNFWALASPSVFFAANKYKVPVVLTLHNYRLICPSATLFYRDAIYEKSIHTSFPLDAIRKGVYRNSQWQTAALAAMTLFHNLAGTWRKKISRYIVLTDFARKKFEESTLAIPRDKFILKPNFVKDHGAGQAKREDFFLFIGRLTAEKGIGILLKAARTHKFNLSILGDGPYAGEVAKAALTNANIHYSGQKDRNEIISSLKKCKALIFPSLWYEGFPITILEAFSTGTPVIASRLGSIKEIVKDGINGLHFEPGNTADLGRKVQELMTNDGLRENLSRLARLTYEQEFTPEKNYEQLIGIYEGVLAEQPSKITTENLEASKAA